MTVITPAVIKTATNTYALIKRLKVFAIICICSATLSNNAMATETDSSALQMKLKDYDGYQANFAQKVNDSQGNEIHQAKGKLVFKQPGKFLWQLEEPEEELLLSNGKTVWWFNPFVEQVSIYDVGRAVTQTPFALLVSQDEEIWQQFDITKSAQGFIIKPKDDSQAQVIKLEVHFGTRHLNKILITSRSRQVSEYTLSEQANFSPDDKMFEFKIPAGIDIDDQRASQPTVEGNVSY